MGFTSVEIIAGLVAAIGGVIVFMGINQLLNPFLTQFSILVLLSGVILIVFAKKIQKKIGIKDDITHTVGGVLVFLGLKNYLITFVSDFAFIFLIVGTILILFRRELAKLIADR